MPKAKWTTKNQEIVAVTDPDGTFRAVVPLYDSGVKQLTFNLTINADRHVRLLIDGEPGATITGFECWSDI